MPEISSKNKRIAKNTVFLYVRMLFVLFVSVYTTRVVLRVLGVEDFGVNNVVTGFVALFGFLSATLASSIQRFYNYEMGKSGGRNLREVYITSMEIQIILAVVVVALGETIGLWYVNRVMVVPDGRLVAANGIYQFAIITFVINIICVPYRSAVNAFEKMDFFAIVSVFEVLLKLGVAVVLQWLMFDKLIAYGALLMGVSVIALLMYYLYCKKKFDFIHFKVEIHKGLFREILSFSGWNLMGTFSFMTREQGANMLLNYFFGAVVNAARGVSYQVLGAIQGFTSSINVAFTPQLVQSYAEGNHARALNLMYSMSKITFYLFYMFSIPIVLEMDGILQLWLGDSVPEYTSVFSVLVIAASLLANFNYPVTQLMFATGEIKVYQIVATVVNILVIPIAWFCLFCGMSPESVFVVLLVMGIVNQATCLGVLRNQVDFFSIRDYVKRVLCPSLVVFLLAPILSFLVVYTMQPSVERIVVTCFASVAVTCPVVYFFGLSDSERTLVWGYVSKIIKKLKHSDES